MAKRTPRTEAKGDSATAAAPPARPEKAPRRRAPRKTAGTATKAGSESSVAQPSEEDIRKRAYMRYLERGGLHGLEFEDWLEAERELKGGK